MNNEGGLGLAWWLAPRPPQRSMKFESPSSRPQAGRLAIPGRSHFVGPSTGGSRRYSQFPVDRRATHGARAGRLATLAVERFVLRHQLFGRFLKIRIDDDAVRRADEF